MEIVLKQINATIDAILDRWLHEATPQSKEYRTRFHHNWTKISGYECWDPQCPYCEDERNATHG